jgi:hypothetical protein
MTNDIVKIKLRDGAREFEAEGPLNVVQTLLNDWKAFYKELNVASRQDLGNAASDVGSGGESKNKKKRKGFKNAKAVAESQAMNTVAIANEIKGHKNWPTFSSRIVLAAGKLYEKAALVLRFSPQPLTSGDIAKVQEVLGIKADRVNFSNCLKANLSKLMTDGARSSGRPKYKLTAAAIDEFDKWVEKK